MSKRNSRTSSSQPAPPHGSDVAPSMQLDSERFQDELAEALWALDQLGQEEPAEALGMFERLPQAVREMPDFQLSLAFAERNLGQLEAARDLCREVLAAEPESADAHHLLGDLLEDLGDAEGANHHFLETLRLDRRQDELAQQGAPSDAAQRMDAWLDQIADVARGVVERLPDEFRQAVSHVPILVESRPSQEDVRAGSDPRSLGLFHGPDHAASRDPGAHYVGAESPSPTRIVLYAANLLAEFDDDELDEQVRVTVLHELGHYFGLDEQDMERLGLA